MRRSNAEKRTTAQAAFVLLLAFVLGTATVAGVNGLRAMNLPTDGGTLYNAFVAPALAFLIEFPVKQFVFFFGLTAFLAVVIPATRKERFLSKSLAQDFVWFILEHMYLVLIMATCVSWLKAVFDQHPGLFTTDALQAWPLWAKLVFGLVLADFLHWVHHFLMHKVPILWKFHKLHHSQREMNFFTNYRVHLVDHFVFHMISGTVFLVLSFDVPQIYLIMVFLKWHPVLIHANIRTNLGPLKYILVTPQSHRVHHSHRPEYHDMNFGVVLCVWDRLFGTQVRDYEIYPETGLKEPFPIEQDHRWWLVPLLPLWQTLYPFWEIAAEQFRGEKGRPDAARAREAALPGRGP